MYEKASSFQTARFFLGTKITNREGAKGAKEEKEAELLIQAQLHQSIGGEEEIGRASCRERVLMPV